MAAGAPGAEFRVEPEFATGLASEGITSVARVLERSECVRDLPDRSNHVLRVGSLVVYVKRRKRASRSAEALAIARAQEAGVPTATIVFEGVDRVNGAIVGTLDLAPARPLDDLLAEGLLSQRQRVAVTASLAVAVAALHRARLFPRDLYLNHVFVDAGDALGRVTLIDLERMTEPRWFTRRAMIRDLAALRASIPGDAVSPYDRRRFLEAYLLARGLDPNATVEPLARAVSRKAAAIRKHVPRTPVGDAARPTAPRP